MKKILLYLTTVISAAVIPVIIAASIILTLFLTPGFHVSIIKNLSLVKTFIEAKNFQIEKDIKREIEKKTGITEFKTVHDRIKREYEERLLAFNTLNKTDEYKKIEKQIDELDDLEWEKSSDAFKKEEDFDSFKKHKMNELKSALKGIEDYRDKNEDPIEKAEDEMDEAKDKFEDAEDELKDKEEDARDIIEDRHGDFMNEMYHDVAKIEPALTGKLNRLFIETEVRNVIAVYIDFFTSYFHQKKTGNVYTSRLTVDKGIINSSTIVTLPPLRMSFNVKDTESGDIKRKNLLSEIFVETIRNTPGLKSPWVMSKIFSMSDSWIVEKAGNSILKDTGITYSGGVIKSGPIVIKGEPGRLAEKAMIGMTAGRYLPYAAAGITLILLILVFLLSRDRKNGLKNAGYILKYPAIIAAIAGLTAIILSLVPGLLLPEILSDPVKKAFLDRVAMTSAIHIFAPVTVIFFLISLAGSLLIKLGKR
ncbi:MAG TPA: hypothetical protein PK358_11880 [Spirochaetota bacterium]|nr:hypothetical protein [Spirochaetota bacterium]HPJ35530.1 hypothetical protein [Spirochaetota bacterium]